MSLLAHRGSSRRRGRSGFLQTFVSTLRTVVAGKSDRTAPRGRDAGMGFLIAGALVLLAAGYGLGNAFPWRQASGLRAPGKSTQATPPSLLDADKEMEKLSDEYLAAAGYFDRDQALAAARTLRAANIPSARLLATKSDSGSDVFVLAVYFHGEAERDQFRQALLAVESPDAMFDHLRKRTPDWPVVQRIR